jgi:Tol biopolymer transport system component
MSGGDGGDAVKFARLTAVVPACVLIAIVALVPLVAHAAVGDTTLVSAGTAAGNADSGPGVAVNADGRYVVFESKASNLDPAAVPGVTNIYKRDTQTGTTTLVSRATGADGAGADGDSAAPTISPAGRFVAFESTADNLSGQDDDSVRNVFVRDTMFGTTTLVSVAPDGSAANGDSSHPSISANGTMIAFDSTADNLSTEDLDQYSNVYVRNMDTGELTLVSKLAFGQFSTPANDNSWGPTIDRDGRRVAFTSDADNLSTKDANQFTNVFVTDLQTKFTSAVSLPTGGFLKQDPSDGDSSGGVLSADGRYVAFVSSANNFTDESLRTPKYVDVFRRDIQASKTVLVSRVTGADGGPALADSGRPSISGDGRFVAFESSASNLGKNDTSTSNVFIRNVEDGVTTLVDRASGTAGQMADGGSYAPVLSRDGRFVAFSSDATNLSADDDHRVRDVFERQVPVAPPPPDLGPDLGTNDHSAHEGHDPSSPEHAGHAGHTAAEHEGHTTVTGGPGMTLFGPPVQDVDKLYMLAQVHADAKLLVTASVKLPGKSRSTALYSFKSFSSTVPAHKIYRVKLKLAKSKLHAVKRAIKRGKKLKATIVGKAQNSAGGNWTTITRTVRLFD